MGLILLSNSKIQTFVAQLASVELSNRTGADIRVGSIEYQFFNDLEIKDLMLYDQQGDTLCGIGDITVNFDFFKIFSGQFLVHKVALDELNFQLRQDRAGKNNLQFLLDLLPHSDKPFEGIINAPDIQLMHSTFVFARQDSSGQWRSYRFSHIDGDFQLHVLTRDSLDAQISNFQLNILEKESIRNLTMHLQANRQKASFNKLCLSLPNSEISFDRFVVRYDSLPNLKHPERVYLDLKSRQLKLMLCDLAPFFSHLRNNKNSLSAQVQLAGSLSNLRATQLDLFYNKLQLYSGSLVLRGLPNIYNTNISADINRAFIDKATLQDLIADFTKRPFVMPKAVQGLSSMSYHGHISGQMDDMVIRGLLSSNLGAIQTDAHIRVDTLGKCVHFKGAVSTQHFHLGQLIGNPQLGNLSLSANTTMAISKPGHVTGVLNGSLKELVFRGYCYHNIHANGQFTERSFNGSITANSQELDFKFLGSTDLSRKVPDFKFDLQLNHLRLHDLNLIQRYPMFDMTCHASVNLSCNSLDNLNGSLQMDSLGLTTRKGIFWLEKLVMNSTANKEETDFNISSDVLNVRGVGKYTYSTLYHSLARLVQQAMPSLIPVKLQAQLAKEKNHNEMDFYVNVQQTEELFRVLDLPIKQPAPITAVGNVSDKNQSIDATLSIPELTIANRLTIRNIDVELGEADNVIHFNTSLQQGQESQPVNVSLNMSATKDSARAELSWLGVNSNRYKGTLLGDILVRSVYGEPNVGLTIQPSSVVLADSVWHMAQSHITLRNDTSLQVDGFRFSSSNQEITINGRASRSLSDSIAIGLNNIDLSYWLKFVKLNNIWFGGRASGEAVIYGAFGHPAYNANVSLLGATINDEFVGNVQAHAQWSPLLQMVKLEGIIEEGGRQVANVTGSIATNKDSVDFHFDCDSVNLAFINAYTEPISLNIQGRGFGHLHLYKYPSIGAIRLTGDAFAKDGSIGVTMLGTRYYLQDTIRLEEKRICFDSIPIRDAEGHQGMVNGYLAHDGAFHDFKYFLDINVRNILALNTTMEQNDLYFGHVYGTGHVGIIGNDEAVNINVNALTEPKSTFCISASSVSVARESDFVRFVNKNSQETAEQIAAQKKAAAKKPVAKLHLQLGLEATPDLTFKCIVDPKTGDALTARGNGSLRVTYDGGGEVKLYGDYTLESGSYSFTFQDVIHRDFKIDRGSTLKWSGNPLNGNINITARYNTTASLTDLDATIAAQTSRKSVPVSCILHLTDKLSKPDIDFDIDLPNTEDGIKQQVKNLINTDELRNREVLYLLLLNKFYKPDYMSTTTNNISQNDAYSLLTSTVTGQINNWISRLSSNFTVGLNIRTNQNGDESSQEYAGEFMFQPNPRLVINGNLGYRNDATSSNKFIADADIEYMLTRSGKLRAKAYTHTVDKYEDVTKDGTTKQGVGFIYRRDFNHFIELFQRPATKRSDPKKSTSKSTASKPASSSK